MIAKEKEEKPTCIEDVLISSLQEMKALKYELESIYRNVGVFYYK